MKNYSIGNMSFAPAVSDDVEAIGLLLGLAFGFSRTRSEEYIANVGLPSFRVLRTEAGAIQASAALLETAHLFGGREVPAASIAHIAIAPEARGRGLARPIVEAMCAAAKESGAAIAALFASTRPVYRKFGFELAGSEIIYEAETAALPSGSTADFVRLALDDERIAEAYREKAVREAGLLRRTRYHWAEVTRAPHDALAAFGIGRDRLQAYVIIDASDANRLEVRDWHAEDGEMAKATLCFLGRFRSVYPIVRWHGAPDDDLVAAMPDKGWHLAHQEEWLTRVLDPARALRARGYGVDSSELVVEIGDAGAALRLQLSVSDGIGTVTELPAPGPPTIRIEAGAFGSLFTGFRSATKLARQGVLSGDADAVRHCDRVFAGPRPWVAEHF